MSEETHMPIITKPYLDTKIKPEHMVTPCEMHQRHGITIITTNFRINTEQMVPTVGTFDRGLEELEDYDSHLEASGSVVHRVLLYASKLLELIQRQLLRQH